MANRIEKVPQIMQMEALECGAACLAMILAYYGRWEPLEQVRADCGVSRDGSKAINIVRAARAYGLAAKGKTYSTAALREHGNFPCIVFWNFNHFIVLNGFKGNWAYINDPARGQLRIPMSEFNDGFTGVVLEFERTDAFEEGGNPPQNIKFARERLAGMGAPLVFMMLTAAIASLVTIIATSLDRVFIDRIIGDGNIDRLGILIGVLLTAAVIYFIATMLNAEYLQRLEGKIAVVSSSRFMRHLLHLPMEFYSQRMVGDLQQRQSVNETIAFTLIGQLAPVLVSGIMLVFYLAIMVRYSVVLTLVGVIAVVLNAFVARYISKKRVNISRSMARDSGKLYAATVGGIEMIETIKAAGAENGYFKRWAGYQASVNLNNTKLNKVNEYLGTIPLALVELANITVLTIGVWLIVQGDFTPGALLAFQGFLAAFMAPVTQIINLGQTIQEMQTQVERVEDVMRYEVDVPEDAGNEVAISAANPYATSDPEAGEEAQSDERSATLVLQREKLGGQVDLEGVTFGYSPLEPPLIEDFDLHLKPGQWVALVGSSGCGKSTIAKLISGLYKPWEGQITFDGIPADQIPRQVFRSSLAVVDQDIVAFEDSVNANVKLWDNSIEDYEVIMACRDADIHDVIVSREGGYSSPILPGGRNFSGGQLQRLEIARVLAQDPTVVILDEATSALDAQTEADVIEHIRNRDITCIVVAHRLSTIRDCDEIIVLDKGKIVERGTHEELLAKNGAYAELVRSS